MTQLSTLKIFLSSPGAVAEERALAEIVFRRLDRWWRRRRCAGSRCSTCPAALALLFDGVAVLRGRRRV